MPKFEGWSRLESAEGKKDPKGGIIKAQWENDDRFAQVVVTKKSSGRWNRIIRDERIDGGSRVKDFGKRKQAMRSAKRYIERFP